MKKVAIVILIVLIGAGSWFAYGAVRKKMILDSGRNVLLINEKEKIYAYTDTFAREELNRDFKVVGYVDDLTEQKIEELTEGLQYAVSVSLEELLEQDLPDVKLEISEGANLDAWDQTLSLMPEKQRSLCEQITRSDNKLTCLFRHAIFNAMAGAGDPAVCESFTVNIYKQECRDALSNNQAHHLVDADSNGLLDQYEFLADPEKYDY